MEEREGKKHGLETCRGLSSALLDLMAPALRRASDERGWLSAHTAQLSFKRDGGGEWLHTKLCRVYCVHTNRTK